MSASASRNNEQHGRHAARRAELHGKRELGKDVGRSSELGSVAGGRRQLRSAM